MASRTDRFVRPPTLTATVTDHIRESIVRGHLAPGSPLHEVDLCNSLGISRGTVREALRQLQDENLVEIVPHQGACVTALSPKRAWEIYTLRAQLEPYAVRLAMERKAYRPQDLEELDALVRRLGELERQGDPFDVVSADMEFHRVMCERSEHALVLDMLRSLRFQTRLFILNTLLYHSDLEQDERTHRTILDRICAGDPVRAEASVHEHIINAGTYLARSMEAHGGAAGRTPGGAGTGDTVLPLRRMRPGPLDRTGGDRTRKRRGRPRG